MVVWSSNLISVIKQFNIPVLVWPYSTLHEEFIYLLNIYLLNNKQGLKAHFNKTWRYPNSKILFYNDYRHDLIMNFLLNSFNPRAINSWLNQ